MPRRVSLPGASELFRPTDDDASDGAPAPTTDTPRRTARRSAAVPPFDEALPPHLRTTPGRGARRATGATERATTTGRSSPATEAPSTAKAADKPAKAKPADKPATTRRRGSDAEQQAASGRVRHDEKITVYVSTEELIALESARLQLRGQHGVAADRGRIVRESIAIVMADLAEHGADSELVRRLGGA